MASLEELLAEEGFKTGKLKKAHRGSPAPKAPSIPAYYSHSQTKSVEHRARRNKSRSDGFSRRSQSILSAGSGRDQSEDLRRSVLHRRSSVDGYRRESPEIRGFDIESFSEDFNGRYHVSYPDSIEELDEYVVLRKQENLYSERYQKSDSYRTSYSNELYEDEKVERE